MFKPKTSLVPAFEKPYCERCKASHLRPVGRACTRIPASAQLEMLLERFSFDELLKRKMLYDIHGASERLGLTPQHIRLRCREGKVEHILRTLGDSHQYFFLPEHLGVAFRHVKAAA